MDYFVATGETMTGLRNKVLEALNDGFKCQGGITFNYFPLSGISLYYQAMVKMD